MIYHHFSHGSKFTLLYVCSFGKNFFICLPLSVITWSHLESQSVEKNKQVPVSCIWFAEDIQGLTCICHIFYSVEAFHAEWFFLWFCFVYDFFLHLLLKYFNQSFFFSPFFLFFTSYETSDSFFTCYWLKYLSQSFVFSILWNNWPIKAIGSMTVYSWVNTAQTCQFQSIGQCLILCLFSAQWY